VLVLGSGAGVGAMLGLWGGVAWWAGRTAPDDGASLLPALVAGAVGSVAGALGGVCLAAVAVVLVTGLRRGGPAGDAPGREPDQSRSS
jgi:hypothetical protein